MTYHAILFYPRLPSCSIQPVHRHRFPSLPFWSYSMIETYSSVTLALSYRTPSPVGILPLCHAIILSLFTLLLSPPLFTPLFSSVYTLLVVSVARRSFHSILFIVHSFVHLE